MYLIRRLRLVVMVAPIVAVLIAAKWLARRQGLEFVSLDMLITSLVAGAIFIVGFLLSHVMADYKEAERLPADIRVALEAIHDDAAAFARTSSEVDLPALRGTLVGLISDLETGLGRQGAHEDLSAAIARADEITEQITALEDAHMSQRYIVRLRQAQDQIRRAIFRIAHMQRTRFVPAAHMLVLSLSVACLGLLMLVRSHGPVYEPLIVFGLVAYLFVYALALIEQLEKPFRKGVGSTDDVSLFLLRDLAAKLRNSSDPVLHHRRPHLEVLEG